MTAFVHHGDGHYLGSTIVVFSLTKKYAKNLIRQELDKLGLTNVKVNIVSEHRPSEPKVIYSFSGNY